MNELLRHGGDRLFHGVSMVSSSGLSKPGRATGMMTHLLRVGWPVVFLCACSREGSDGPPAAEEAAAEARDRPAEVVRSGSLEFFPAEQRKTARVGTPQVEFLFKAYNSGSVPVEIVRVDTGCACIEESVEPARIPPGGEAEIRATYLTEKVSGLAEKVMVVETDEAGARPAILQVKLEMEPVYRIDPALTTWEKGRPADTRVVKFEVAREEPIHLLEATSMKPGMGVELVEVEKGRYYEIHLTPSSTDEKLLGMVRLETDCGIPGHSRPLLFVTVQ